MKIHELVVESQEGKNLHLEHLEDLVFNLGYSGAVQALDYVNAVRRMLASGTGKTNNVTVKWDGAPAIFAGTDPQDGKFFVGTKGVFAKNSTLIKNKSDLAKFDEKPGLKQKLAVALEHLPKLGIGGVLQGDLMFTSGDIAEDTINNEEVYTFTPNTITYAVPKNSELGKRIANAKLGIVFHTTYTGSSLPEMQASFGASVSGLNKTSDVWFDDATYKDYTGIATLSNSENAKMLDTVKSVTQMTKRIGKQGFDLVTNKEFGPMIKIYMNQKVRAGETMGDPKEFIQGFLKFYINRKEAEIDKLKSGPDSPAAQKRIQAIRDQEKFIQENAGSLYQVLAVYKALIQLKLLLLKKLNKIEQIGTFIKTDTGYRVTNPEGYVAIGHQGGAVKLADRLEFSKQNFNAQKAWKTS